MARYDQTRFLTTHNSYTGGTRGSLPAQLSARIRCVEFDIHDNEWLAFKDYRIGHLKPGLEVSLGGGNPATLLLSHWLAVLADWSNGHAGHGPITLVLDAKDGLTDNDEGGDLEDLSWTLLRALGQKLFTREDFDANRGWPDLAAMRNRILCVLSGDGKSRLSYRWAYGAVPSIAVNGDDQVALAYCSTDAGDLRVWTGRFDAAAGSVGWLRRLTYSPEDPPAASPAIGITDGGWIVLCYRYAVPGFADQLASHVGRFQDEANADGRIAWFGRRQPFAAGSAPSLEITGDDIVEMHTAPSGRRERVLGTLDRAKKKIKWQKPKGTTAKAFPINVAARPAGDLTAGADANGWIGTGFNGGPLQPVRFRQVLFVEVQGGEDPAPFRDALFFAANAKDQAQIAAARATGMTARAWAFENGDQTNPWVENMPSTNTPSDQWYRGYVQGPDVGT